MTSYDNQPMIQIRNLEKKFAHGDTEVVALDNIDLDIHAGEFMCLMGPSGSGKSTLLHILAGIDSPTGGECHVLGQDLADMTERELAHWRNEHIGFIFQSFNLIPVLTAAENVEMPLLLTGLSKKERAEHVETALSIVGLSDRVSHYPRQLSGGQEQRVAIARALVTDPLLILADEPTGDLDAKSAEEVMTILRKLNQDFKKTIIMVTHDIKASHYASVTRYLDKAKLLPLGSTPQ
ncbi:MAG TPA: ABC transporter ATP-binding protein [Candidatus Hydrogenedentes bacterium]|nr:ABC transporter ATP-binding protein [Candidatus Hydrogenedentota bacterium]